MENELIESKVACEEALKLSKETEKANIRNRAESLYPPVPTNFAVIGDVLIDELDFYHPEELEAIAKEIKGKVISLDLKKLYICGKVFKQEMVTEKEQLALRNFLSMLESSQLELIINDKEIEEKYSPLPLRCDYRLKTDSFGEIIIVNGDSTYSYRSRKAYASKIIHYTKDMPRYERQNPYLPLIMDESQQRDIAKEKQDKEIYADSEGALDRILGRIENTYISIIFDSQIGLYKFQETKGFYLSKISRLKLLVRE